jgi:DNA invertase Pin-like site-specific DNA recombinase
VELGYARVSTAKQDLDRQIEALAEAGIGRDRIYVDKKSGATVDRPGLRAVLEYAREGDVIVVHTLDRLGRTVRDTLNMIHELSERGIGVRNLADPIRIDSTSPGDPIAQLAVVLLALFAQMERTYTNRACRARPRGRHGEGAPSRTAGARRPGQARVRGAPTRPGRHDRGDRQEDRDPAHQPVPAPAATPGAGGDRGREPDGEARRRAVTGGRTAG